jgi:hypothetical protein
MQFPYRLTANLPIEDQREKRWGYGPMRLVAENGQNFVT